MCAGRGNKELQYTMLRFARTTEVKR